MCACLEKGKKLRAIVEPHHNCAQSVLMALSSFTGMEDEVAYKVSANFGAGMKCGSVCGAITGALMALGLAGKDDSESVKYLFNKIKDNHQNTIDCVGLLEINKKENGDKKQHCDSMVYECIKIVEEILSK